MPSHSLPQSILLPLDAMEAAASIRSVLNSIAVTPHSSSGSVHTTTTTTVATDAVHHHHHSMKNKNSNNNNKNDDDNINDGTTSSEYYQRLQSYSTIHYFAKPIHLSPILCAVTGWELMLPSVGGVGNGSDPVAVVEMNPINTATTAASSLIDATCRLRCGSCRAVLTMVIPSTLSTLTRNELVLQYQQQLYQAHAIACRHYKPAEYFIHALVRPSSSSPPSPSPCFTLIVPTLLSRAIQSPPQLSSLDLVEQIQPWLVFQQKFTPLYQYIQELDTTTLPFLLPDHIRYYHPDQQYATVEDGDDGTAHNATTTTRTSTPPPPPQQQDVLSRLVTVLLQQQQQQHLTHLHVRAAEITTALIITGWDLVVPDHNATATTAATTTRNQERIASIHCIFCSSQHCLIHPNAAATKLSSSSSSISPATTPNDRQHQQHKRPRTARNNPTISSSSSKWNQPYMAHRYYCPWVCGFPLIHRGPVRGSGTPADAEESIVMETPTFSVPLWQVVTNRLLTQVASFPPPSSHLHSKNDIDHHDKDDDNSHRNCSMNNDNNTTMIQNFLTIHQQLRSSISPLRYPKDHTKDGKRPSATLHK